MKQFKKVSLSFILILILAFFVNSTTCNAASYYSNNKELDSIFKKMEKEFLSYKKDEVIPKEYYSLIVTEEDRKNNKPSPTKKISVSQMKAAAQKQLNEIRVHIEIKEEELGGLTKQDYKMIEDKLEKVLLLSENSTYGWNTKGNIVSLYVNGLYEDYDAWNFYRDLKGKFVDMGEEKDQVNPSNKNIKDRIVKYLNQSSDKGNKVSSQIISKLPGEVDNLFKEKNMSHIVVERSMAEIHDLIYNVDYYKFDGTDSVDDLIESFDYLLDRNASSREDEKKFEYFNYPKDKPSEEFREIITKKIINEELSNSFISGFANSITADGLAKLYFEQEELLDKIEIEGNIIKSDSPDYIKNAFIYGMIDNQSDLDKPLTRLEAARKLVKGTVYEYGGPTSILQISDYTQISVDDQITVSTCISRGMKTRTAKFAPKGKYTKEQAINDSGVFKFENLRGYNIPISFREPTKIIVGKSTINLLFESNDEIEEYMEDHFDNTVLGNIKLTGKYTKIDTGGVLIELFTSQKGIKFTMKKGVKYVDFEEGIYGPELQYKIEPKVIKISEKVNMNLSPDSIYKKLNKKLDAILKKIIKSSMTQEQKVKAIHDFVVKHITYDSKYQDEHTIESIITTIDIGKGVCGDYSLLFLHLCRRASIPCVFEAGSYFTLNHAWNSVYVNGKWLFVDTTWDDGENGKILYKYYLKDKYTFMKSHTPYMGIPNIDYYTNIDNMNIKSQDELRAYLLKNISWVDGYKLTFRMANKKMEPFIAYMRDSDVTVSLKYDSKKNLYTLYVKGR